VGTEATDVVFPTDTTAVKTYTTTNTHTYIQRERESERERGKERKRKILMYLVVDNYTFFYPSKNI